MDKNITVFYRDGLKDEPKEKNFKTLTEAARFVKSNNTTLAGKLINNSFYGKNGQFERTQVAYRNQLLKLIRRGQILVSARKATSSLPQEVVLQKLFKQDKLRLADLDKLSTETVKAWTIRLSDVEDELARRLRLQIRFQNKLNQDDLCQFMVEHELVPNYPRAVDIVSHFAYDLSDTQTIMASRIPQDYIDIYLNVLAENEGK